MSINRISKPLDGAEVKFNKSSIRCSEKSSKYGSILQIWYLFSKIKVKMRYFVKYFNSENALDLLKIVSVVKWTERNTCMINLFVFSQVTFLGWVLCFYLMWIWMVWYTNYKWLPFHNQVIESGLRNIVVFIRVKSLLMIKNEIEKS